MGIGASTPRKDPPRSNMVRLHTVDNAKLPMPEQPELERRFTKVLNSMDLPPDKAKLLKQYDDEKKWDMICDQEKVIAKEPPSFYLRKLKTYLDPRASRSAKVNNQMMYDAVSTLLLPIQVYISSSACICYLSLLPARGSVVCLRAFAVEDTY